MDGKIKKCARPECGKTVYPLEELKCLDKTWHKACFKCSSCGMALSMKNYKGYDKKPYCEAHYPKQVASFVSDTPEMRRLQENTKNQSLVKYHEDYERSKGTKINVTDDPEMQRHMKNSQVVSQVAYHGDAEKRQFMESSRPPLEETANRAYQPTTPTQQNGGASFSYSQGGTPYSAKLQQQQTGTLIYSTDQGQVNPSQRQVGSISDYDPARGNWGSVAGRPQQPGPSYSMPAPQHQMPAPQHQPMRIPQQPAMQQPAQMHLPPAQHRPAPQKQSLVVRAVYDYTAADTDEVSFAENDLIVNVQSVDEGWMTGTVQRTGQWGMLPANYVERVN